jgi:lysophospholipase L1-like esterase
MAFLSTSSSIKSRLLLAGFGLALGLLIAEVGLRLYGFSAVVYERPDTMTGTSLRPSTTGWQTVEGAAFVAINSQGFRDRERTVSKPVGTVRIAVLGDSFVEARQVASEDTFVAVLERRLAADPRFGGRTIEVLNFGVAGYGTAQQLLTLRRDVLAYQPDHVILAVFTGNDISDNSKALSHPLDTRPYFGVRGNELVLDTSFLDAPAFRDRQSLRARLFYAIQPHVRLVQLAYRASRRWNRQPVPDSAEPPSPFNHHGLLHDLYRAPIKDTWQEAWRVTERLLLTMQTECAERGIRFGVVTLSNPPQVSPDSARRQDYERKLGVTDLLYPDRRIRAIGEQAGFPVLNLAPLLQAYAVEHQVYLHGLPNSERGMGHWNAPAHQLVAELIAQWLSPGVGAGESTSPR